MDTTTALILIFMLISPCIAVRIAHSINAKHEKRQAQLDLLKKLLSYRKNFDSQMRLDASMTLNVTEIVFADSHAVVAQFQKYQKIVTSTADPQLMESSFLDLIASMCEHIGYKHLTRQNISACIGPDDLDWMKKIYEINS